MFRTKIDASLENLTPPLEVMEVIVTHSQKTTRRLCKCVTVSKSRSRLGTVADRRRVNIASNSMCHATWQTSSKSKEATPSRGTCPISRVRVSDFHLFNVF